MNTRKSNSSFGRGKPTFKCQCCERLTRQANPDCDWMCDDCYELAGIDNFCNDNAQSAEEAGYSDEIARRLAHIAKLGGNVEAVKDSNSYLFTEKQS